MPDRANVSDISGAIASLQGRQPSIEAVVTACNAAGDIACLLIVHPFVCMHSN